MNKTYELCADYFASVDFDWLKDYEILGVEQEISVLIEKYQFTGYIDLLLKHKITNELYIVDHKSSAYPFKKDGKTVLKKSQDDFNKYKKQMYLYCKYIYEQYGSYPNWIMWNHFKEQKIAKINFSKEDYDDSISWFLITIHKIEEDELFEPNENFFFCTQICEFRNSCEYANQEE